MTIILAYPMLCKGFCSVPKLHFRHRTYWLLRHIARLLICLMKLEPFRLESHGASKFDSLGAAKLQSQPRVRRANRENRASELVLRGGFSFSIAAQKVQPQYCCKMRVFCWARDRISKCFSGGFKQTSLPQPSQACPKQWPSHGQTHQASENQVSLLILIEGNFDEKSFALAAILMAT